MCRRSAALEFGHCSFREDRTNAGFCGQRSYGNRILRAAKRRHLSSPTRERWGSAFVLKTFKPRSGDISMHKTALFTGVGEKNVAAPRLIIFVGRQRSQCSRIGLLRCRRSAALRPVYLQRSPSFGDLLVEVRGPHISGSDRLPGARISPRRSGVPSTRSSDGIRRPL
jgi:hypothetical protein